MKYLALVMPIGSPYSNGGLRIEKWSKIISKARHDINPKEPDSVNVRIIHSNDNFAAKDAESIAEAITGATVSTNPLLIDHGKHQDVVDSISSLESQKKNTITIITAHPDVISHIVKHFVKKNFTIVNDIDDYLGYEISYSNCTINQLS